MKLARRRGACANRQWEVCVGDGERSVARERCRGSHSRDVDYGDKLNLTTGRSGLILDLVVEAGNPADSERL